MHYIKDGREIYQNSFAIIRAEADLDRLPDDLKSVAVRMMHSCGMTDLADDLDFDPHVVDAARSALQGGAPILCDAEMIASGITRKRLPAANDVICTLNAPEVPALAKRLGTTRSAAALDLWRALIEGSVVAIGNAPTALFRLFELLAEGWPRPAAIIGLPVGFVGAAESKAELARRDLGVPYLTLKGRRGGSAMTVAAINAIATEREI